MCRFHVGHAKMPSIPVSPVRLGSSKLGSSSPHMTKNHSTEAQLRDLYFLHSHFCCSYQADRTSYTEPDYQFEHWVPSENSKEMLFRRFSSLQLPIAVLSFHVALK